MYKMIPHINVLYPLVKHTILCQKNSTLTITKTVIVYKSSLISPNNPLYHIAFLQASIIARCSVFVIDNATVFCKVALQSIAQPPMVITYSVRDFQQNLNQHIQYLHLIYSKLQTSISRATQVFENLLHYFPIFLVRIYHVFANCIGCMY